MLELLLPSMAAAHARVVGGDRGIASDKAKLNHVLSRRELQVLKLVRDGLFNTEIAVRLQLSAMTAKNHVQNIRKKLGVKTRGQAVAEALRLGLILPRGSEA